MKIGRLISRSGLKAMPAPLFSESAPPSAVVQRRQFDICLTRTHGYGDIATVCRSHGFEIENRTVTENLDNWIVLVAADFVVSNISLLVHAHQWAR